MMPHEIRNIQLGGGAPFDPGARKKLSGGRVSLAGFGNRSQIPVAHAREAQQALKEAGKSGKSVRLLWKNLHPGAWE